MRSDFKPCKPGHVACPKCFGETSYCLTPRTGDGWPLGKPKFATCNFCDGEGEITTAKAAEAPSVCNHCGLAGDHSSTCPVKPQKQGWSNYG